MHIARSFILIITLFSISAMAQDSWQVKIGVNGLTCSACSRSVEMGLRRLDFVDSVVMSLETTEGTVITKKGTFTDFGRIAKAVTDAGFSVRFLQASFSFEDATINQDGCFEIGKHSFQWVDYKGGKAGQQALRFVDEPFLPGKEFNQWKKKLKANTCFPGKRIFHLTNELE